MNCNSNVEVNSNGEVNCNVCDEINGNGKINGNEKKMLMKNLMAREY